MVVILVAAEKATELPRLGRASRKLSKQASHTTLSVQPDRTIEMAMQRTSADRRPTLNVNLTKELMSRNTAVSRKRKHHPRI